LVLVGSSLKPRWDNGQSSPDTTSLPALAETQKKASNHSHASFKVFFLIASPVFQEKSE
jgi:hypothetical protein